MVGLTDPTIARAQVAEMGAGWAGHDEEKMAFVWLGEDFEGLSSDSS